jgi:hypothetical protein
LWLCGKIRYWSGTTNVLRVYSANCARDKHKASQPPFRVEPHRRNPLEALQVPIHRTQLSPWANHVSLQPFANHHAFAAERGTKQPLQKPKTLLANLLLREGS